MVREKLGGRGRTLRAHAMTFKEDSTNHLNIHI